MIIIYRHEDHSLCFTCAVKRASLSPHEHPVIVPQLRQGARQDIECGDCDRLIEEEV